MSLTNTGMSFQSPFSFALATVMNCGWYRKTDTESWAIIRCASPSSLARSAAFSVVVIFAYSALNFGES